MGKRRKARESALQILYQTEFDDSPVEEIFARYWEKRRVGNDAKAYAEWLVQGILSRQKRIDSAIQSISEHWRLSRMALVDRNILRMAVFELLFEEDMTPAIVINEAIEIAKKYSGQEAAHFVNGILDALSKKSKKEKASNEVKNDQAARRPRKKK